MDMDADLEFDSITARLICLKLREFYPDIAKELFRKQRDMTKQEVFEAFEIFCRVKGISPSEVKTSNVEIRDLVIAVFTYIYDPEYFMVEKKIRTGLRGLVSKLIGNKGGGVSLSYNFKDAKSYLNIYPSFKEEAETISEMILSELDKDKQEVA